MTARYILPFTAMPYAGTADFLYTMYGGILDPLQAEPGVLVPGQAFSRGCGTGAQIGLVDGCRILCVRIVG